MTCGKVLVDCKIVYVTYLKFFRNSVYTNISPSLLRVVALFSVNWLGVGKMFTHCHTFPVKKMQLSSHSFTEL